MKYEEEYQLKKQKLWRPLTVGLTAMMLAAPAGRNIRIKEALSLTLKIN